MIDQVLLVMSQQVRINGGSSSSAPGGLYTHAQGNVEEAMSYLRTIACAKIRQDAINAPPIDVD